MEPVERLLITSPNEEETVDLRQQSKRREKMVQPSSSVVEVPEEVMSTATTSKMVQEELVVETEKLSELKFVGNLNNNAHQAVQSFIRCKVKSEIKFTSLQMKLQEVSTQDAAVQHQIATLRQNVAHIKARNDLQDMHNQMVMEDYQTTSKLITAHTNEYESIVTNLNNAVATKAAIDKECEAILEEEELLKREHAEKYEIITKKIEGQKKKNEEDNRKRQEILERYRGLLADAKRRQEERKTEKASLKKNLETKRKELQQIRAELTNYDNEIDNLVKSKEELVGHGENLKHTLNSLLSEMNTNKSKLKEIEKLHKETEVKYEETMKQLDESKSKNILLSESVRADVHKLENSRCERQNISREYEDNISKLQEQLEELKNKLNSARDENANLLETTELRKKVLIEHQGEYESKKSVHDELISRSQIDLAVLEFAQHDVEVHKERLDRMTLEKEKLQKVLEDLSKIYEDRMSKVHTLDTIKNELRSHKDTLNKKIVEKSVSYEDCRKVVLYDFDTFKGGQESIVNNEEGTLREKQLELEKLEASIKGLKEQADLKKVKADELYNNCAKVEKEIKEVVSKIEEARKGPKNNATSAGPSTSEVTKSFMTKGILKSPERHSHLSMIKKVTFDPALDDGLESEGSVERMFEEFFGKKVEKEAQEKRLTSEELFDNMLRTSPPEKDKE